MGSYWKKTAATGISLIQWKRKTSLLVVNFPRAPHASEQPPGDYPHNLTFFKKSKQYFIKWVILYNTNISIITIVKKFFIKRMDWFSDFQIRPNCTFTQNCLCMKPKREQHKNECFCSPFILLINSLLEKQLQVCYLRSETVEESKVSRIHL